MQTHKMFFLFLIGWLTACHPQNSPLDKKLQSLSEALPAQVICSQEYNSKAKAIIEANVKRNGSSRAGMEWIKRIKLLKFKTNQLIDSLQYLKDSLNKESSKTSVYQFFKTNNRGKALTKSLDNYVSWLGNEYKDLDLPRFEKLTQVSLTAQKKTTYPKEFIRFCFAHTKVSSAVLLLTQFQFRVLQYQQEVLQKLGTGDLITGDWGYSYMEGGVSVKSKMIKLGELYEAEMFMTGQASRANLRMTLNGTPIAVRDGKGEVHFKVPSIPDSIPKSIDKITRYWEGSITFKSKGKDTTLKAKVPYTILRRSKYQPKTDK